MFDRRAKELIAALGRPSGLQVTLTSRRRSLTCPEMARQILIHPDPRLRKVCDEITDFGADTVALSEELLGTMYEAPGLGLAAPQIGVLKRMLVMDCSKTDEGEDPAPICMINPQVVTRADETSEREEGCLSLPRIFMPITRPAAVRVRYQDPEGAEHERDFEGLWATCVQHEMDHLDGKLFVDYISGTRRAMITQKMKRLKRDIARDPDLYPYSDAARMRRAAEQS